MKNNHAVFFALTSLLLFSCETENLLKVSNEEIQISESKAIIGKDDRRNTSEISYVNHSYRDRVGQLITTYRIDEFRAKTSLCSATLINKNFIITAAHCAFQESGSLHENQFFYPSINKSGTSPKGKYRVKRVFFPQAYHPGTVHYEKDIAIMELEKNDNGQEAGSVVGTLGFWGMEDFPNGEVMTVGYPGDKETSGQYFENGCNAENELYSDGLKIDCDVFGGQSGSPILVYSEKLGVFHVQGVVVGESSTMNYGTRISSERQKIIRAIVNGTFKAEEYHETWREMENPVPQRVTVLIKNICSNKDLYVAYYYKQLNNEWLVGGYQVFKPNEERNLFESKNGVYYLQAARKNGDTLTRSDTQKYLNVVGRNIDLQKYTTNKWGPITHQIGCN